MNIGSFEAKTHFSELIEGVQKGEEYIITKRGKPVARIIPYSEDKKSRKEIITQLSDFRDNSKGDFDIIDAIRTGRK